MYVNWMTDMLDILSALCSLRELSEVLMSFTSHCYWNNEMCCLMCCLLWHLVRINDFFWWCILQRTFTQEPWPLMVIFYSRLGLDIKTGWDWLFDVQIVLMPVMRMIQVTLSTICNYMTMLHVWKIRRNNTMDEETLQNSAARLSCCTSCCVWHEIQTIVL